MGLGLKKEQLQAASQPRQGMANQRELEAPCHILVMTGRSSCDYTLGWLLVRVETLAWGGDNQNIFSERAHNTPSLSS